MWTQCVSHHQETDRENEDANISPSLTVLVSVQPMINCWCWLPQTWVYNHFIMCFFPPCVSLLRWKHYHKECISCWNHLWHLTFLFCSQSLILVIFQPGPYFPVFGKLLLSGHLIFFFFFFSQFQRKTIRSQFTIYPPQGFRGEIWKCVLI